jgi:hypothetical protein
MLLRNVCEHVYDVTSQKTALFFITWTRKLLNGSQYFLGFTTWLSGRKFGGTWLGQMRRQNTDELVEQLSTCRWVLAKKLTVAQLNTNFPSFYETRPFIAVWRGFDTGPYPGPAESSPYTHAGSHR